MKKIIFISLVFLLASCKFNLSMNGASIPPDIKTCTVDLFVNQANLVVPTLANLITEKMKDKIQSNTNISLVNSGGDVAFKGTITGYAIAPVAAQANETAALNRLTVTVSVDFTNTKNEKENWSQSFSRYQDYNASVDLSTVQDQLIEQINKDLVDDIFNKAFLNW